MFPGHRFILIEEIRRGQQRTNKNEMRLLRNHSNPFELPDHRFIDLFRLNKDLMRNLINALRPHLQERSRITGVLPEQRIFAALLFYATGSYQRLLGQGYLVSMSQQLVSKCVREVTEAIYFHLDNEWINFPASEEEKMRIKISFMEKTRFPGTIAAIDCTHVAILKPRLEEHNYLNRKGYHSKNVQIICDNSLKILSVNARYAGASHDSFIWRESVIQQELIRCYEQGNRGSRLIGDSGYPQEPWLMTSILNPPPNSAAARYNLRHASARNCVERCIGVLKNRLRCILHERVLRYSPELVEKIVTVCTVLHNMCINANIEGLQNDFVDNIEDAFPNRHDQNINGDQARLELINRYFR
ncbi:hypothetical protein NQ314_016563 [Rhamnusium bicolor]|uniref:DDE Tnp4 domain-containing protein n=1 Tax=Rhamnusium bicolor TaxID=1586634 RepID=A0AAV8WW78_9CUCU|nr:hypothetical protein NQ314_016563 [Rhamnusium bicolor]